MNTNYQNPVRIFRISLYYRNQPRVLKKWLYESHKTWAGVLTRRKKDPHGEVRLLSEEVVDGSWVVVEDWKNYYE